MDTDIDPQTVIERLGGNAKTAALCEVTPAAVSQWLANGIPKPRLMFLKAVRPDVFARRRATDVSPPK